MVKPARYRSNSGVLNTLSGFGARIVLLRCFRSFRSKRYTCLDRSGAARYATLRFASDEGGLGKLRLRDLAFGVEGLAEHAPKYLVGKGLGDHVRST